jgi:hypothetical protein
MLEQALALGLPCFPCRNTPDNKETDKTPLVRWRKDASANPDAIRKMFSRHPGCLIAVPTGAVSGIDILDIDPRHGGDVWYLAHKEKLPPTRIHRTRSRGLHLLFLHTPGLRNSAGKIAPGIDTRAEGGYFIWWPATGLEFQDYPPGGLPEWPLWLLPSMMTKPVPPPVPYPHKTQGATPKKATAIAGIVALVARASEGERNNIVHWAACRFAEMARDGIIDTSFAKSLLIEAGERAGLTASEIIGTTHSAFRNGGR